MSQKIKNIIFDVGNVLIDFCWEKHCRELGYGDAVIQAFADNMINSDCWDRLDEGTMEEKDAIVEFIHRMPQYKEEICRFWDTAEGFVEEYDYSAPMIDLLHRKGYKVYLLSNYPLHMYEIHWPSFTFFPKVDGYVVSAVEKLKKPDIAIYQRLLNKYHLDAAACLFVDDRKENTDAARKIGMQAVQFDSIEQLEEEYDIFCRG